MTLRLSAAAWQQLQPHQRLGIVVMAARASKCGNGNNLIYHTHARHRCAYPCHQKCQPIATLSHILCTTQSGVE